MADIAFLLLIFFLVTTTIETDAGLARMLPRENDSTIIEFKKRNVLRVALNTKGEVLVNDALTPMEEIKDIALAFIDNGGGADTDKGFCSYCQGEREIKSSISPQKAVIAVSHNRETSYGAYITLQNELVSAYNQLRNREAMRLYNQKFTDMQASYLSASASKDMKTSLRKKVKHIQSLYPLNITEAVTQ